MAGSTVRLADVTTRIGSGITPRGGSAVYRSSGRPFVRSQNVGWGELRTRDLAYIDEATHATFAASEIRKDDILLNITGASIGRAAIASEELEGGNVNQHVCEIRLKPGVADPQFVSAVLNSRMGQDQIDAYQAGGNRQGLNFQQVGSIKIPALEIKEQEAIGAAAHAADELSSTLQRLIAKKQAVRLGMRQHLLNGKSSLAGFTGKWAEVSLVELADKEDRYSFVGGPFGSSLTSSEYTSTGVRILQLQNIGDGEFRNEYAIYTSDAKADSLRSSNIYPGDILLAKMGDPVARACLVPAGQPRYQMASDGIRLAINKSAFDPRIVMELINSRSFRDAAEAISTGSTRKRVSLGALRHLKITLPLDLEEQQAIARMLSEIDDEIATLRLRLTKAKAIKQGMMQELLSGRVRLGVMKVTA